MNKFLKFRNAAINWLNGKRDFSEGIEIMMKSRFKPGVVNKLKNQGEAAPAAQPRLECLMRELVKAWTLKESPVEIDTYTGEVVASEPPVHTAESKSILKVAELKQQGKVKLPGNASEVVRQYSNFYKIRDKKHKELAKLGELNDAETIQRRKLLLELIEKLTNDMETLYPLFQQYTDTQRDIPNEQMDAACQIINKTAVEKKAEPAKADFSKLTLEELQQKKKNLSCKITRCKNMLEYGQTTKLKNPNPLPESPRRAKYEKKLSELNGQMEQIEYALVDAE